MASEKLRKDDQATSESEIHVNREVDYPQIQTQFEKKTGKGKKKGKGGDQKDELSLDEISNLRQNAQQKSIDAVKGLEERYQKVKGGTTVGGYVGEKTVAAKDAAVGAGKTVVGYTEKVAVDAKDRAVVAGLGAAKFTTEKTVAATKATADLVGGMTGYVGEKAAVAKDTVMDYVGEKVVQAKDAVVSAEESAAAYTARKKAEAERQMEANKRAGGEEWKGEVEAEARRFRAAAVAAWLRMMMSR